MILHDAAQRHQVAVDVVERFNRCGLGTREVGRGTAGKDFDVTFVGREERDKRKDIRPTAASEIVLTHASRLLGHSTEEMTKKAEQARSRDAKARHRTRDEEEIGDWQHNKTIYGENGNRHFQHQPICEGTNVTINSNRVDTNQAYRVVNRFRPEAVYCLNCITELDRDQSCT